MLPEPVQRAEIGKVIASIEDPVLIERIFAHVGQAAEEEGPGLVPFASRGPPQRYLRASLLLMVQTGSLQRPQSGPRNMRDAEASPRSCQSSQATTISDARPPFGSQ